MRALFPSFGLLLLGSVACAELPEIPADGCGNRLINEATEDCDGPVASGTCGEPGSPGACRFLCERSSAAARGGCPEAFACGLDGVCRRPTGVLQGSGAVIQILAEELHPGDVDGDGRTDLLALAQRSSSGPSVARVLYFGDGGSLAVTAAVPGEVLQPLILPLSSDTTTSALISNSIAGLSVTLGSSSRSFVSKNYPSIPLGKEILALRGLALDVLPASEGDELLLLAQVSIQGMGTSNVLGATDGTSIDPVALLPDSPDKILGGLPVGHLLWPAQTQHPCPSVVLAFDEASELLLFTPCVLDGGGSARWTSLQEDSITKISLANGGAIAGKAFVVDIDRDGWLDVLLTVREGSGEQALHAAYGTGKGYLVPRPGAASKNVTARLLIPAPLPGQSADESSSFLPLDPLGVGHFDQDKFLDFIDRNTILASAIPGGDAAGLPAPDGAGGSGGAAGQGGAPGSYQAAQYGQALFNFDSWTEVKPCDLNGDGILDFAAARGSASLDVLLGKGNGLFSNSSVPLNGLPGVLTIGDFDGDLLDDVAFRELAYDSEGNHDDALAVLFGARQGVPSEVVRVGRFGEILSTASGNIFNFFSPDLNADLGLFSRTNGELRASQFFGASDRQLRSFLTLQSVRTDQGKPEIDTYAATGLARVRYAAAGAPGVAALGVSQRFFSEETPAAGAGAASLRLWRLEPDEEANFSSLRYLDLPDLQAFDNVLSAGDLDGDGGDEVVLFLPPQGAPGGAMSQEQSSTVMVFKASAEPSPAEPFQITTSSTIKLAISQDSSARIADLDGDGLGEMLLLNRRPKYLDVGSAPGGPQPSTDAPSTPGSSQDTGDSNEVGSLWLIRQKSKGELDWQAPQRFKLPDGQNRVTGFCLLQAGDATPHLLVSTEVGVFLGRREGDAYTFKVVLDEDGDGFVGVTSVACGDLDGDGVEDVALSSGDGVEILRGLPRLP